jgi:hypothetical protein
MNPYAIVGPGVGTTEAASLRARLMAWHDAMVAHERRLRSPQAAARCDDECPHVEARALWAEVSAVLGPRASGLTFLRSRALGASASSYQLSEPKPRSSNADAEGRSGAMPRASLPKRSEFTESPERSWRATADL